VVFLAQNEQRNLAVSLPAAAKWGARVYVIDGGSRDESASLCEASGAVVLNRPFDHWASQRNWALQHQEIDGTWILFLDADEEVTDELRASVVAAIAGNQHEGWYINRRFWFLGRPLRHCGLSPNWALRLVRRNSARWKADGMREFAVVDGSVGHLEGHVEHADRRGVVFWSAKHVWLAAMETTRGELVDAELAAHQEASSRRFLRRYVLGHLPRSLPALLGFLYRYVWKLGFLDGHAGFSYCMMREFWFPVLVADALREQRDGTVLSQAQVERLREAAFGPGW
jgi:glycosyltransferase involved in cell wall biosynthesis